MREHISEPLTPEIVPAEWAPDAAISASVGGLARAIAEEWASELGWNSSVVSPTHGVLLGPEWVETAIRATLGELRDHIPLAEG